LTAEDAEFGTRVEYARLGHTVETQTTRVAQALREPGEKAYPRLELCGTYQMRQRERERLREGDRERGGERERDCQVGAGSAARIRVVAY
jgi:hypothetical protein